MLTLYGILYLDFFQYDRLPPYCVSTKLKPINTAFLGYISAFYPILLIFLTWLCVELHDRNFRLLVWLWRPFHRCFVRLRRGLDTKSDIIDVFTTFFILSYSKILYQTELFTVTHVITNINEAGRKFEERRLLVDPSIIILWRFISTCIRNPILIHFSAYHPYCSPYTQLEHSDIVC